MIENRTFEEAMTRLEEIVRLLDSPQITLEEGLALYKEGAICSRFCRKKLEEAKHQLEIWKDGDAIAMDENDPGGEK